MFLQDIYYLKNLTSFKIYKLLSKNLYFLITSIVESENTVTINNEIWELILVPT
jgi:hypothetical protein